MSLLVARSILVAPAHGGTQGVAKKCHDALHRLGLTGHLQCGSIQRNMSILSRGKLHSHYTLPSGDKIPAVALGVWRAGKEEVGPAVKVTNAKN
ncbi:hypothetical protein M413DRAFT_443865 [Hebeloma cylindrosporum]|uniref:NADP-dependent oxidoreductase domain-containing protein n=1 Tax=Hebeloma cylindrosporum TaxID=76867 RepID=A0A0C3CFV4_HEBCY|nr:hypothetical protein M413DRAFT_443865 [Hebeloma cylindrosporum h7]